VVGLIVLYWSSCRWQAMPNSETRSALEAVRSGAVDTPPKHPNEAARRVLKLFYDIYLARDGDLTTWWLEYGSDEFKK
jgi:hypothetical protein